MATQVELQDNEAALIINLDGDGRVLLPESDPDAEVPHLFVALFAVAMQLQDNPLFLESLLEWFESKLDEDE